MYEKAFISEMDQILQQTNGRGRSLESLMAFHSSGPLVVKSRKRDLKYKTQLSGQWYELDQQEAFELYSFTLGIHWSCLSRSSKVICQDHSECTVGHGRLIIHLISFLLFILYGRLCCVSFSMSFLILILASTLYSITFMFYFYLLAHYLLPRVQCETM